MLAKVGRYREYGRDQGLLGKESDGDEKQEKEKDGERERESNEERRADLWVPLLQPVGKWIHLHKVRK